MSQVLLLEHTRQAISLFIETMRPYLAAKLELKFGDSWSGYFGTDVVPHDGPMRQAWREGMRRCAESNGNVKPEQYIDLSHFSQAAIKYKDLLKEDFGQDLNKLKTWLDEIRELRNKQDHRQTVDPEDATRVLGNIIKIGRHIKAEELAQEVERLRKLDPPTGQPEASTVTADSTFPGAWFRFCIPSLDIRLGRLNESEFAANLAEVAAGSGGREVYANADQYFEKTYFTAGYKVMARRMVQALNGSADAENRVISLQTGFGGGKTHLLIGLYHLAKLGKEAAQRSKINPLLLDTSVPTWSEARLAAFTNDTHNPATGRPVDGGYTLKTIWSEIAYQLLGSERYKDHQAAFESLSSPIADDVRKVLMETAPCVILLDEVADYCVRASTVMVGASNLAQQTISFMQALTEAASQVERCFLVTTLPASDSEVAAGDLGAGILRALENRVRRVGADTQPVADEEVYEVIKRRLFQESGLPLSKKAALQAYHAMYRNLGADVPDAVRHDNFLKRFERSYPFHPDLLDVFRVRWASYSNFQRTRGALRLMGSIVADLWSRKGNLREPNYVIMPSHVKLQNLDALTSEITRLAGNGFQAVISSDVANGNSNASQLDELRNPIERLNQSIATVILLNTLGGDGPNKGLTIEEIKVQVLEPGYPSSQNDVNSVLDKLEERAHFLYYGSATGKKRYWFGVKPNLNILIRQACERITEQQIQSHILNSLESVKAQMLGTLQVLLAPMDSNIPEQKQPTLVLLHPSLQKNAKELRPDAKERITELVTKRGNLAREYKNVFVFCLVEESKYTHLASCVRDFLGCERLAKDGQVSDPDQQKDLRKRIDDCRLAADYAITSAYKGLARYRTEGGTPKIELAELDAAGNTLIGHYLKQTLLNRLQSLEWLLPRIGYPMLQELNMVAQPGKPFNLKDHYEAFLRFADKPLLTSAQALRDSIERFLDNGQAIVAVGKPGAFTRVYQRERPLYLDIDSGEFYLLHEEDVPPVAVEVKAESTTVAYDSGHSIADRATETSVVSVNVPSTNPTPQAVSAARIVISGQVPLENWPSIFNGLINPLRNNQIEIEIVIKAKSVEASPLVANNPAYANSKETARQLGLKFEEGS